MLVEDVMKCSFPNWYTRFEKVTIKSEIIPLPKPVLEYLLEDGQLVLPVECNKENYDGIEEDYDDFGDTDWTDSGGQTSTAVAESSTTVAESSTISAEDSELSQKSFPEFSTEVKSALDRFNGQMFCKLNWSSPKDATWIGFNNSLKVGSLSQLYLLLKSSDFITNDLTLPFKFCEDKENASERVDYALVLRKWVDVNPGTEYRCFVVNKELKAISQRDDASFYDHIPKQQASIKQDIFSFFHEHIQHRFACTNYAFDVIRSRKDRVILVDFNPFGETTESLFFTWEELRDEAREFEFRFATDSSGVQPSPYRHYSLPRDFVDLSTGSDPAKLIDFLNLRTQNEESDSD